MLSVSATHWAALAESQGNLFFGANFQGSIQNAPATLVLLNTWQHFALVKRPGEYSIYIDGQLQFNGPLPPGTDGPYNFGGSIETGDRVIGEGFRGYLDEFRISDEALTPDQFLNIPEPGTVGLAAVGLGVCGWWWRRRRQRTEVRSQRSEGRRQRDTPLQRLRRIGVQRIAFDYQRSTSAPSAPVPRRGG